ncbi:MAG: hypothetical protein BWZ01_02914 [Deltaproteobacteria bacterium ADurb.BinA179]|nr:MAG: hypothetical protein BWZ01_02914 [Deltaproteobacteria bacterium ADurb.BinA179]
MPAGQRRHVAVAQAVALPRGDLEADAGPGRQFHGVFVNETRMGQDVDVGLYGGEVRALGDGLHRSFAVHDDDFRPRLPGFLRQRPDPSGRHVRDLDARQNEDPVGLGNLPADLGNPAEDKIEVGVVRMIRDGHGSVSGHGGPAGQLGRDQFPVAEERVHVQIDHGLPPSGPVIRQGFLTG